ncbi:MULTISPECIES: GNAT family N-acetyltransferase [Rhodomicrobium]|uniref:GNAT family N-acetyltransferase n=1 Tax=Rhodomicrobium TaxID=1068 RepID=UPI000B4B5681|nr:MULTISPECIES: GNAT family N-acetyltransferase [Rhodomicrobium]
MSETAISIRPAQEADLPAVLALYAQPDMDDGKVLPLPVAARILDEFARYPNYTLYVAESGAAIVGAYTLLIMHNLGHLGAPSAIVEGVVVDPAAQGQGVGGAMMRHAMDEARGGGCYKLVLSSNIKRVRAHEFYDKLGFERHGISFTVRLDGEGGA